MVLTMNGRRCAAVLTIVPEAATEGVGQERSPSFRFPHLKDIGVEFALSSPGAFPGECGGTLFG